MEILIIGNKIDIEDGNVNIKKEKNRLSVEYNKIIESYQYNDLKINWSVKINFIYNKIKYIESTRDIYVYDYTQINDKDKIYNFNRLVYLGYSLKEYREIEIKKNGIYLLSPSEKVSLGNGRIETDFGSKLIEEDKVSKDLLLLSDGLLIFNNTI
ncbi:hypothetical protein MJ1_0416 [Nanobdella aerobiophila]|uniref:Uncharacterized protein n=1 Tax=Nanobdella aerobiophila TaxID=2586965 RepID=A0A915SKD8_9ARCH|nr:hypothetical protein [Nanobdella aerobiophila]BBL45578.1 hypothetical protein MJ1_0416 [Nanobdella aerobiophila]